MPVYDLFLAGALGPLLKQLDGITCLCSQMTSFIRSMGRSPSHRGELKRILGDLSQRRSMFVHLCARTRAGVLSELGQAQREIRTTAARTRYQEEVAKRSQVAVNA